MRYVQFYPQAPKRLRTADFVASSDYEAKEIALDNFRNSQYTASRLYPYGKEGLMDCIRTFTGADLNLDLED